MNKLNCSFDPCDNKVRAKGLCATHYYQQRRGVELFPTGPYKVKVTKICSFVGCGRQKNTQGLCHRHWQQKFKGEELTDLTQRQQTAAAHGTPSKYNNDACRCDLCRIANNAYNAGRKSIIKRQQTDDEVVEMGLHGSHGKSSTYSNYGCRCADCKSAWAKSLPRKGAYDAQEEYDRRNGKCDCCGKKAHRLYFDHDHETDAHRGYLCVSCNTGIGKLGDNIEGLQKALAYLSKV